MSKLYDSARKYLGVRWRHRGRSRYSIDCAGLVVLAYRDLGVKITDYSNYGREPHNDGLIDAIKVSFGEPVLGPIRSDDILVIRYDIYPHHVLIAGERKGGGFNVIHADGHYGKVIEHRLDEKMMNQITHIFRKSV